LPRRQAYYSYWHAHEIKSEGHVQRNLYSVYNNHNLASYHTTPHHMRGRIIPTTNAGGKKFAGVIPTPLLKPVFTPFSFIPPLAVLLGTSQGTTWEQDGNTYIGNKETTPKKIPPNYANLSSTWAASTNVC